LDKKLKITKDFDSADIEDKVEHPSIPKKATAADRIRNYASKFIEKQRKAAAYRKSPEYIQKQIDKYNLHASKAKAIARLEKAKTDITLARSKRQKEMFKSLEGGFGGGSVFSGMDSMFGIGTLDKKLNSAPMTGMNELFGFGGSSKKSSHSTVPTRGLDELFGVG
jgi:hypothetical protein